jgi:hypothetical protein
MSADLLARLSAQFAAARDVRAELLRLMVELGATCGVEVLRFEPGEAADVWDLRLRISTPSVGHGGCASTTGAEPESEPETFVSPARDAEPFVGDGTADLPRLIAASDPRVRVPPRGGHAPGAPPPPLGAEERLRMLAGTIAGDALLSLQHQGRERDGLAVRDALARAREHYAREIERAGGGAGEELLARFDAAAEQARRELVGVG